MMRTRLSLLVAAAAALGAVTAATGQVTPDPTPEQPGDADRAFVSRTKFSEVTGEKLYTRVCAACHMPDAKGAVGAGYYPALARNPKLEASGYPVYVILNGLNGMPAIGRMMSDEQVAQVVNHIRTHYGNKYRGKVTAADVKAARAQ